MIQISSSRFGVTADGREIIAYTMTNSSRIQVKILSYGCAVQSIIVPDRNGVLRDVALGYDNPGSYENGSNFFGAFVGRFANRIGNARFTLNGRTYNLNKNEGKHHLHGTFAHRHFNGIIEDNSVVFRFVSPPSEEGYPGTLKVELRYRLTENNALEIDYTATTDEDTIINLTNHTYFNLNGNDGSGILSHTLTLDADSFTELDCESLPTGRILSVKDTPFDFRKPKQIGEELFSNYYQLRLASGYDHNIIINGKQGVLREFARAASEKTGITLTASTTEPAVQLYTGNFIQDDAAPHGKNGVRYPRFGGFCLEAQHYPDSPNLPHFPSTVLRKGETYRQKTVYCFSAE